MPKIISKEDQKLKMRKLYNYENLLYPALKERNTRLRKDLKELKRVNKELEKENKLIQKLLLELEELKEMHYGKKQIEGKSSKVLLPNKDNKKGETPNKERTTDSYRRSEPNEEDITGEIKFDLNDGCPDCGSEDISKIQDNTFYREDLAELDILLKQAKTVTKKIIETGYCGHCKKRKAAFPIPKQKVSIGRNTKATIVYLHVLLGLSYSEVQTHLKSMFDIDISQGQISNSLNEQADLLKPYYSDIYSRLLSETGCHFDETTWKILGSKIEGEEKSNGSKGKKKNNGGDGEGNYSWAKTGVESNDVIFWFGRSRGKGVAEKLRGDTEIKKGDTDDIINIKNHILDQVGITDDYGSYRNTFKYHQLCWAHPFRKIRDLAQSGVLEPSISKHCIKAYENFSILYKNTEKARDKFNKGSGDYGGYKSYEDKEEHIKKLKLTFDNFCIPHDKDPEKLKKIKETLKDRRDKYFTFMYIKGTPLDNNKAERVLRKIVLKRKKSFGCKSQKGANTLSILYSVVFSIFWSNPEEEFLNKYHEALDIDVKKKK